MNPSPETCKRLTEYIEECWHQVINSCEHPTEQRILYQCSCFEEIEDYAMIEHIEKSNRPFTTTADLFAVFGKMWRNGDLHGFMDFAHDACPSDADILSPAYYGSDIADFTAWLFCLNAPDQIGERMEMAAAFLKERER